jgi:CRP/FNR family transcriptional regulator
MITGQPYTISAIAVEPSAVCFVPNENIHRYLRDNPQLSLRVLQLMSHELQDTERRVVELAQKSVRERVAEALLVLRSTFGTDDDGETLNMPLTREEIADIVGTAPESLIRMLSEFKADHVIETVGRRIKVKNVEALRIAANLDS